MCKYIFTGLFLISLIANLQADYPGTVIKLKKDGFSLRTEKGDVDIVYDKHLLDGSPDPRGATSDDTYRLRPRDLREGMEVLANFGDRDGLVLCMGLFPQTAAISFRGLTNVKVDYTLELRDTTRGGEVLKRHFIIKAGTKSEEVAAEVFKSFERPRFSADRWSVVMAPSQVTIEIDGFYKGDKFEVVDKVELNCPELSEDDQRPVRQLGKPWSRTLASGN